VHHSHCTLLTADFVAVGGITGLIPGVGKKFVYKPSKLTVGPSQSAFQWVSAALSPKIKQPEPEDIHIRRVLKLRMSGAVPLLLCMRCAVHSDTFTLTTDGSKCISCGYSLTAVTWAEVMTPEITLQLCRTGDADLRF
jgi:hypothetical protein